MDRTPAQDGAILQSQIEALRHAGAQHFDPMRFRYFEVLLQRMQPAPAPVQALLQAKLKQGLQAYRAGWQAQQVAAPPPAQPPARRLALGPGSTALADLNRYIQQLNQKAASGPTLHHAVPLDAPPDLKSLAGFREVWAKIAAEDQLDRAWARQPENAGPLNPHMLVLRTLGLMRQLSPEYLGRFMAQVDALLWLEQAQAATVEVKPTRRARPPKARSGAAKRSDA